MTPNNQKCRNTLRMLATAITLFFVLIGTTVRAQDPAQYGTPFNGVPDPQDASIYQVNMRCFSSTRNLQGVINRLDNIRNLGVKVIQLMPLQPVSTHSRAINSPYAWKDFTSVGAEYGSLATLRALVDGAHSRGMSVIMDWVANQTGWDHPWITQHPDWYIRVNGVIQSLNGWNDVAALDMNNASMRAAQITAMRYWIFAANIDGYRFDYANGAPAAFWTPVLNNLRGITSHKLILNAEGDGAALYSAGFDYTFSWNFYSNMKSIRSGSSATLIDNSNSFDYNGATGQKQVVRWLSNHDMYGSEGSPYNIFGGKNGTLAAFVVSAYMKSVPLIYNGMEVGNTVAMPFPFTSSVINWSQDVSITPEITKILNHRNYSNAIRRGTLTSYTNANVCVFKKVYGNETVFVMSNQRNSGQTITLPSGIANTTMYDAYTNAAVGLTGNYYLAPYQWVVLKVEGTPPPAATYYSIRNRWTNNYLYDAGANVGYGSSVANNNYKWQKVSVDATNFMLKNLGTGEYMHIENQTGAVQCTSVDPTFWSAHWTQQSVDATYSRLRNRWQTGNIIHVENQNGSAQYAGAQDGWYSAHWILSPVSGRLATEEETTAENGTSNLIDVYPNPSGQNKINIFIASMKDDEKATLTIQDLNGRNALQTTIGKNASIAHNLTPGLYVLRIRSGNFNAVKKVMVEK